MERLTETPERGSRHTPTCGLGAFPEPARLVRRVWSRQRRARSGAVVVVALWAALLVAGEARTVFAQATETLGRTRALGEQAARNQAFFFRFDENEDGAIDFGEFKAAHRARFLQADRDGDGEVTATEWLASRPGGRLRADRAGPLFDRLDADGSETLTDSEFANAADWWFSQLDLDADGVLNLDELGPPWRRGGGGAEEAIPGR